MENKILHKYGPTFILQEVADHIIKHEEDAYRLS